MVHHHHHKKKDSSEHGSAPTSPRSPSSYTIDTGPKPMWPTKEHEDDPDMSWRRFLFILFEHPDKCLMSKYVSAYVFLLIFVSSVSAWIETIPKYQYPGSFPEVLEPGNSLPRFQFVNDFCMWMFLFEYMVRAVNVSGADVDPWKDIELYWDVTTVGDGEKVTDKENNEYQEYYHEEYNRGGIPMGGCTKFYCWATKALSVVDFAAILPFVLELLQLAKHLDGFISLRYLRLIRVFRVLKLQKQTIAVALFVNTIRKSAGPLGVLMFFVAMAVVVFGSVVYQVEHGSYCDAAVPNRQFSQRGDYDAKGVFTASADGSTGSAWVVTTESLFPKRAGTCNMGGKLVDTCCDAGEMVDGKFVGDGCYCRMDFMGDSAEKTPFYSVFVSFWWVLTTITTVGYGDCFPTTLFGRLVGAFAMCLGVVGFAMPIGIIGNAFEEEYLELSAAPPLLLDEWMGMEADAGEDERAKKAAAKAQGKDKKDKDDAFDKNKPEQIKIAIYNPRDKGVLRKAKAKKTSKEVMTVLNEVALRLGVSKKEWESFKFQSPLSGTESAV